ncbi:Fur family ferric uptake transcriptional regulator [Frondihabitans sp. PhB188]|uniref:Fur family transcriptional regulator n=1 Tax=Frondihabitans sp. PhB188 TaxID=2485200 RepID=UPI000F4A8421|nr:Fur family transcriptional regulator [Frondihabitans sp. PhB188]ROQ39904.1 Fur family ferric uptake transcriptional regulator [Frondihabitans sp. PhB188]
MESNEAGSMLRDAGLRVTAPRLAALEALGDHSHATVDEVYERVATGLPGTSLQAMYVVLAALTGAGLVRRIEPAGSAARYELRIGDNHHHVVCSLCGAVEDVDCVVGEAPCLMPSHTSGYLVQTAEVTFWGLCPACRALETGDDAVASVPAAAPHDQPVRS